MSFAFQSMRQMLPKPKWPPHRGKNKMLSYKGLASANEPPTPEKKVEDLEKQVEHLTAQLESSEAGTPTKRKFSTSILLDSEKDREIVRLRSQDAANYENAAKLEKELDAVKSNNAELVEKLRAERRINENLEFEIKGCYTLHEEDKLKIEEFETRLSFVDRTEQAKDDKIMRLTRDLQHVQEQLERTTEDYQESDRLRAEQGKRYLVLEHTIQDREQELERVQAELAPLEEERNQLFEIRDVLNSFFNSDVVDLSPAGLHDIIADLVQEQPIPFNGSSRPKKVRVTSLADEIEDRQSDDKSEHEDDEDESEEEDEDENEARTSNPVTNRRSYDGTAAEPWNKLRIAPQEEQQEEQQEAQHQESREYDAQEQQQEEKAPQEPPLPQSSQTIQLPLGRQEGIAPQEASGASTSATLEKKNDHPAATPDNHNIQSASRRKGQEVRSAITPNENEAQPAASSNEHGARQGAIVHQERLSPPTSPTHSWTLWKIALLCLLAGLLGYMYGLRSNDSQLWLAANENTRRALIARQGAGLWGLTYSSKSKGLVNSSGGLLG